MSNGVCFVCCSAGTVAYDTRTNAEKLFGIGPVYRYWDGRRQTNRLAQNLKENYMLPAARVGDMHTCPMATPGTPPVPHVGGPITGPGVPTVLIGGMPAAVMGDMCTCVGPPDTIIKGSATVLIGGKPAARMGDNTAHGGVITVGYPTVLIGG